MGETKTYECWVAEIEKDGFWARTENVEGGSHPAEEAFIPNADVPDGERSEVQLGRFFRWEIKETGTEYPETEWNGLIDKEVETVSLVFDRSRYTAEDIERGKAWAKKIAKAFGT